MWGHHKYVRATPLSPMFVLRIDTTEHRFSESFKWGIYGFPCQVSAFEPYKDLVFDGTDISYMSDTVGWGIEKETGKAKIWGYVAHSSKKVSAPPLSPSFCCGH